MQQRQQVIGRIKRKAARVRAMKESGHHLEHDPEPELPDVLQTVRPRDYREVSLILET